MAADQVELRGVSKVYPNGVEAVSGVDLTVREGEFFTVVGPSGSGKSTLLRLVAGLEEPTAGSVWVAGRDVTGLAPRDRDVAMVFQNPALYPHLSVFDNLAFGLRARGVARDQVRERVGSVAASLDLSGLLRRRPQTLSGGQKQRVALGRAVARRPLAFLLDEPLSSLDGPLRAAVRDELVGLHQRTAATILHVTHDQAEALAVSDRLALMERGRVVQVGPPREVYERPATRFVGGFLGSPPMNVIPCRVARTDGASAVVALTGVDETTPLRVEPFPSGSRALREGAADLGLRPEDVAIAGPADAKAPGVTWLPGTFEVAGVEYLGHEAIASIILGPHRLLVRVPPTFGARPGGSVAVGLDLGRASWFDPETGLALAPGPSA
jgi:ABC-type sugar transport system ATPase subunit